MSSGNLALEMPTLQNFPSHLLREVGLGDVVCNAVTPQAPLSPDLRFWQAFLNYFIQNNRKLFLNFYKKHK